MTGGDCNEETERQREPKDTLTPKLLAGDAFNVTRRRTRGDVLFLWRRQENETLERKLGKTGTSP